MKLTWLEQREVLCFRRLRQCRPYANCVEFASDRLEDTKSGKKNHSNQYWIKYHVFAKLDFYQKLISLIVLLLFLLRVIFDSSVEVSFSILHFPLHKQFNSLKRTWNIWYECNQYIFFNSKLLRFFYKYFINVLPILLV